MGLSGKARFLILFAIGAAAFGQSFDVASIRVSELARKGGEGSRREQIEVSPGSVIMHNLRFLSLVRWAYHVKDYQVNGPSWISSERYDLSAKAGEKADEEQMQAMLQKLLADRFQLAVHKEKKEMSVYVLTVGKGGPKFKPSASDGEMNFQPSGMFKAKASGVTVQQFCDLLSNPLQAPVLDETGLKGKFDAQVDMSPYIPQDPTEIKGPQDIAAIAVTALQEMLGLKLESKKAAVDLIVVDKAEKMPTEN